MWNLRNNTSNPHNNPVPKEEVPKPREPAMETGLELMLRSGAGMVVCVCVCVCVCARVCGLPVRARLAGISRRGCVGGKGVTFLKKN